MICGESDCSRINITFPLEPKGQPFHRSLTGRTAHVQRSGFLKGESFKSGKWGHQQFTATGETFHGYRVYKPAGVARLRHVVGDNFVLLVLLKSDSKFDLTNVETSLLRVKINEDYELLYALLPRETREFDALSRELATTFQKYVVDSPRVAPNNSFKPRPLRGSAAW